MSNPINKNNENDAPADDKPIATLMRFSQVFSVAMGDARAAHDARVTGKPRGPVTGFTDLDKELGGAFSPGVHAIHGDPGAGKTAFALQVATTCQFPALYVTAEMAPAELLRRHAARVTREFLGRFKSGELSPETVAAKYQQAIEAAPDFALLDATRAPAKTEHIRKCAEIIKGDASNLLIIVDSLHSWAEGVTSGNEYEVLNNAIASLRQISHILDCPVIYIAERNRVSMGSSGQSAGAGSRKIEYGAETVISLNRDKDARPDGAGEIPITLKLPKNRHGVPGAEIPLKFYGALQRFSDNSSAW